MGKRNAQSLLFGVGIFELELRAVDLLAGKEGRVAGFFDLDLLQHLPHYHLDVLVVDPHTLQPIDFLNLVDQIARQLLNPENPQDVVRDPVAVHQQVTLLDVIPFLDADVLAFGDQILDGLLISFGRRDHDASLGLIVLAEFNTTLAFADYREVLRLAGLEQLSDAWQTSGDVPRLRRFTRDPREDITRLHVRPVINRENSIDRHEVARL